MAKTRANKGFNVSGQHSFAQVPKADIQRSVFNRSCGVKNTFDSGYLVPVFCDELLPGDTMSLKMSTMCRLTTTIAPVLDNMELNYFFFAVPIRLLWDDWERMNGAQDTPGDSTDFLVPEMESPAGGYQNQSLHDHIGIPTLVTGLKHSALWHRAYNLVWAEWFRDQNLQDPPPLNTGPGPDDPADYVLLKRGKRHDYFTSCLPWPQKGDDVLLPLGGSAPVIRDGLGSAPTYELASFPGDQHSMTTAGGGTAILADPTAPGGTAGEVFDWGTSIGLVADLQNATASTINALRESFQLQRLLERDARSGTRYTEVIRAHFNVSSPDQRLQRPEILASGAFPIQTNPVAATDNFSGVVGELGAYVTAEGSSRGFTHSATEHCVVIGMVSVRADINYQQGLARQFSRRSRFDFYLPVLAHLGEQGVKNKEIFAQGPSGGTEDEEYFGYQEAWAEYRYKASEIHGKMRSNDPQSLDLWHLAQDFLGLPLLNATFIEDSPPVNRIVVTNDEPQWRGDFWFQFKHARPMPTFSVPGMIDHF